jgi:hypothetical protein
MSGKKRRLSDEVMEGDVRDIDAAAAVPTQSRERRPPPGKDADRFFRNLYATEPDFKQLGRDDPGFGQL